MGYSWPKRSKELKATRDPRYSFLVSHRAKKSLLGKEKEHSKHFTFISEDNPHTQAGTHIQRSRIICDGKKKTTKFAFLLACMKLFASCFQFVTVFFYTGNLLLACNCICLQADVDIEGRVR